MVYKVNFVKSFLISKFTYKSTLFIGVFATFILISPTL